MNARLVDPKTWTVLRVYRDLAAALADKAMPADAILTEADSDDAAILQASQRFQAARALAPTFSDDAARGRRALELLPVLRPVVERRIAELQLLARQEPTIAAACTAERAKLDAALDVFNRLGVH